MTAVLSRRAAQTAPTQRFFLPDDVTITPVGEAAAWFNATRAGDAILIRPNQPLPCRCSIPLAALFERGRGFPDVTTVMGRLLFHRGATQEQRYVPYTLDPDRRFREVFLPVEPTPDDELFTSATRWRNAESLARTLLAAADITWSGLSDADIDELVQVEAYRQPVEGCMLHALVQWSAGRGDCVVEIGSLRGRSLTMLARGLQCVGSTAALISIDPHRACPQNLSYVRTALAQLGEEPRLVQMALPSDTASRLLRPGCASLIFIDGDHSYRQVVADYENYRDLLAPGGCLAFHDYCFGGHNGQPETNPDVRRAVDDHVMGSDAFEPLLLAHTLMVFRKTGH